MTELHKATYILKLSKASGYDVICNEMILCLYQTQPELLLKLFNSVFNEAGRIEQCVMSMVTPIFKSGSRGGPSNYTGISVMSCLCKLFCSILNLRLTQYVMEKNILKSEQLGFVAGNRTSDAHIILHTLLGHGITGKFFNNLKMLYTNDNCCIKVGVGVGPRFIANRCQARLCTKPITF